MSQPQSSVQFGPYRFNREQQVLWHGTEAIRLPPRVAALLGRLLVAPGQVVSHDALIEAVWRGAHVGDASLAEAVSQLRAVLQDDSKNPIYIETVHRRGYRFRGIAKPIPSMTDCDSTSPTQPSATRRRWVTRRIVLPLTALVAALVVVAWLGLAEHRPTSTQPQPTRFTIALPQHWTVRPERHFLAIAPDGRDIVLAAERDGVTRLHRRSLSRIETEPLAGTAGAAAPFFAPDGETVAFFADGKLRHVPLAGGPVQTVAAAALARGGSWSVDGRIIFSGGHGGGLWSVAANGGAPAQLTAPDSAAGEVGHWWPDVLPSGKAVLFTVWTTGFASSRVAVLKIGDTDHRILIESGGNARFAPPDRLFYSRDGVLMLAKLDPQTLELRGPPRAVGEEVWSHPLHGLSHYALSANGSLAFLPAPLESLRRTLWVQRPQEQPRALPLAPRLYTDVRADRSGTRLAAAVLDQGESHLWVAERATGRLERATFEGFNFEPVWSRDGTTLTFASNRAGAFDIYRKALPAGSAELLHSGPRHKYPESWHPSGDALSFAEAHPVRGLDLWVLAREGAQWQARIFRASPGNEGFSAFSPDGRWLAYSAETEGRWQLFVEPYPATGERWQISDDGGYAAKWSLDGRELLYFSQTGLISVSATNAPHWGPPRREEIGFDASSTHSTVAGWIGDEVLLLKKPAGQIPGDVQLVLGWQPHNSGS